MEGYSLGRLPDPETPRAAAAYPVTKHPSYRTSGRTQRYWFEGSAWLDQGQTGTCVGNAFAHRLADAPIIHPGITEDFARQLYLDASGDTTLQKGTTALRACRVLQQRGTIDAFHWISTVDELRNTVLEIGSVCVGIDWYYSMYFPEDLYGNSYIVVDYTDRVGGHELVVNGANFRPEQGRPFYRLKNSWGRGWGHFGTARIDAVDLEELVFNSGDAVLISEVP